MPSHDDTVPFLHMLNHALVAVVMIAGKGPQSLAKVRMPMDIIAVRPNAEAHGFR